MPLTTEKLPDPLFDSRVLSPHHPDVLALREAKQVALRSARVPCGATRSRRGKQRYQSLFSNLDRRQRQQR
jgi:hypothetical protein